MIDYINWAWFWARSSGTHSSTITVNVPNRNVDAFASLSRVSGEGSAKAFIRKYCYQHSSDQILCPFYSNEDNAPSVVYIPNCRSVTFEVRVNDMFGYGIGLVFYYQ